MHATLRKLRTRFDSWQGHFGSKMRQGQRRESPRPPMRRSAVRVPYMGSDRKPCQPVVSSVGRAPDQESGCDGFDSRTNVAGRKTARYQESPREAGQRVIGHRTAGMSAFSSTCGVDGSMSERHAVRGYRFCQSSACRRWMSCKLRWGLAPLATSITKPPCRPKVLQKLKRHSALVRVITAGSAAQRRCQTTIQYTIGMTQ